MLFRSEMDMENLDLEEVDKKMVVDEAAQSSALEGDAPESAPIRDDAVADARTYHLQKTPFFFLGARYVLGLL